MQDPDANWRGLESPLIAIYITMNLHLWMKKLTNKRKDSQTIVSLIDKVWSAEDGDNFSIVS
jgi:hypothetical protein